MARTKIEWADAVWNPIPDFPGYYASKDGRILSLKYKTPRILRQIKTKDGYYYVFLYRNHKKYKMWVHRAVLMAFDRKPLPNEECRHLDGNPANNKLENLCWGTRQENVDDKKRHGSLPVGERSGTHKLTTKDVLIIRKEYGKKSLRKLASEFGVSHTAIRRAALGIKWWHLKEGLPNE